MTSMNLLNSVIASVANPDYVGAIYARTHDALGKALQAGANPLALAGDWFAPDSSYPEEIKLLALSGLVALASESGIHPDDVTWSCGARTLLAAAAELKNPDAIFRLIDLGADPMIVVASHGKHPTANTIVGNALVTTAAQPELWLQLHASFGDYSACFDYMLSTMREHANLNELIRRNCA